MIKYLFKYAFLFLPVINLVSQVESDWQNPNVDIETRVNDLIKQLTLEEKVSQLQYNSVAIERLNIPEYNWWNEALHGVARNGRATVFPQAIGLAATFDKHLMYEIGNAISDEARAKFNIASKQGNRGIYAGLSFWSPNVNIFRDPRWGRGQETYGEDPYLSGLLGGTYVRAMQGKNKKYLKTATCAKHFAVHSGPEGERHSFNVSPSKKDLYETYFPAFEALVKNARVEAIMCAYNALYDEPCCGSTFLLKDKLRDEMGFKGHIVSDCWALHDFYDGHNVVKTPVDAAVMAAKAGVNVNCGDTYPYLIEAVKKKKISEEEIDEILKPLLTTRFKLGLLDPPGSNPYDTIPETVIRSPKHTDIALRAAQKSIVMLKNDNVLPLKKDIKSVYVLGPHAASVDVLLGNYYGVSDNMVTILEGITGKVSAGTSINYKQGILAYQENINPIDWTTGEAHDSEAIIVVAGISRLMEGEEGEALASPHKGDRLKDIRLPQNQINYLKKLRSKGDKPIILVVTGGSPIAMPEVYDLVDAILFAWYPGEQGGNAVADIIFGKVSPSGRLPLTFPYSVEQLPPYDDYSMENRTYKFMKEKPQFPFGFGLSYTSFDYERIELYEDVEKVGNSIHVSAKVRNKGRVAGNEVAQMYVRRLDENDRPVSPFVLAGVYHIYLDPNAAQQVFFRVDKEQVYHVTEDGKREVLPGKYEIFVGSCSPGERAFELGVGDGVRTVFTWRE